MKEKSDAGINLLLSKKHQGGCQVYCPHLTDESLSKMHMPWQQMDFEGIWDLTWVNFGSETSDLCLLHLPP